MSRLSTLMCDLHVAWSRACPPPSSSDSSGSGGRGLRATDGVDRQDGSSPQGMRNRVLCLCSGMLVAALLARGPAGGPGSLSGGRRAIGPMSRGRRGPGLPPQAWAGAGGPTVAD
eukprot:11410721-Alexandrium_andersonii.AAC.1